MKKSIISKAVTGMCAMYEFSGGKTLLLHVKYCSEHKADEYLVISNHKYKQGTNVVRVSVTTGSPSPTEWQIRAIVRRFAVSRAWRGDSRELNLAAFCKKKQDEPCRSLQNNVMLPLTWFSMTFGGGSVMV